MIIYYGKHGLEAQVFQSYMTSSGFKVQVVTTREGALSALAADPSAIAVIALEKQQRELIEQAELLRRYTDRKEGHVFVLSTEDSYDLRPAGIDVIPRPYRLSELVKRIQAITKEKGS